MVTANGPGKSGYVWLDAEGNRKTHCVDFKLENYINLLDTLGDRQRPDRGGCSDPVDDETQSNAYGHDVEEEETLDVANNGLSTGPNDEMPWDSSEWGERVKEIDSEAIYSTSESEAEGDTPEHQDNRAIRRIMFTSTSGVVSANGSLGT